MLSHLYNALWYPALPFAMRAAGGRDPDQRSARLGRINVADGSEGAGRKRVWVHAASVGEIEAVRPVVRRLALERAGLEILVTTMTVAGRDAARRRIPALVGAYLAPLDFAPAVRRFLARTRPHLILIAETELWPNFFCESARSGAKVALINGRISERSLQRYRWVRSLIAEALGAADLLLVQTSADAERFRELGAPDDRISVTGNTKFDLHESCAALRPALAAFARSRPILLAGSTAPGEELIVLEAYRRLLVHFPKLTLGVAPRHPERVAEVEATLRAAGFAYARASELITESDSCPAAASVLLIDTMGELRSFYQRAAIAFVGGSIAPPRGGQSLAEPATASVPVLFGPHYENHREVGDAIIANQGGAIVKDARDLEYACSKWLADDNARRAAGQCARAVIERLADGAALTVRRLEPMLVAG
jgi:3-deoxy-D-manno-octulosonic-acid transferase